jgi:polyphosphate kinase 2 (PPK2 family)
VRHKGLKVVIIFEGRDAAGKSGIIKRITEEWLQRAGPTLQSRARHSLNCEARELEQIPHDAKTE